MASSGTSPQRCSDQWPLQSNKEIDPPTEGETGPLGDRTLHASLRVQLARWTQWGTRVLTTAPRMVVTRHLGHDVRVERQVDGFAACQSWGPTEAPAPASRATKLLQAANLGGEHEL